MAAAIRLLPCKYIRCSKGSMHILTSVFNVYKHSDIVWKCWLVQNYFYGYLQCAVNNNTTRRHFTSSRYRGNSPLLGVLCFCSALFHSAAGQPRLARGWAKTHAPGYAGSSDQLAVVLLRRTKCRLYAPIILYFSTSCIGEGCGPQRCGSRVLHYIAINRLQSCYRRCIKVFFGYSRSYSVTAMLVQLGLPTLDTLLHNSHVRLAGQLQNCHNCLIAKLQLLCA